MAKTTETKAPKAKGSQNQYSHIQDQDFVQTDRVE